MKQVSDNVYVKFGLRGCNIGFLVTTAGLVMIDTPQKPTEIVEYKRELAGKGNIEYLINTEPHPDHFTGNYFFQARVAAHEGTRDGIAQFPLPTLITRTNELDPDGKAMMEGYAIKVPEITFTDRMTFHLGEHTIKLIHAPGHTPSETIVYIPEEKVVFAGDNVVNRIKAWLHDAVPDKWLESLKLMEELDANVIVPGHGDDVVSKEYLSEQARVVRGWRDAIRSAVAAGWDEEQTLAKIGNPDPFPMPKGREAMAPMVNKMIVHHLYQLYGK